MTAAKKKPTTDRTTFRAGLSQVYAELLKPKVTRDQRERAEAVVRVANSAWKGEAVTLEYYRLRKEKPPRFAFLDVSTDKGA